MLSFVARLFEPTTLNELYERESGDKIDTISEEVFSRLLQQTSQRDLEKLILSSRFFKMHQQRRSYQDFSNWIEDDSRFLAIIKKIVENAGQKNQLAENKIEQSTADITIRRLMTTRIIINDRREFSSLLHLFPYRIWMESFRYIMTMSSSETMNQALCMQDSNGQTPFHSSLRHHDVLYDHFILGMLLDTTTKHRESFNAMLVVPDNNARTPLHDAMYHPSYINILPHTSPEAISTALVMATRRSQSTLLHLLFQSEGLFVSPAIILTKASAEAINTALIMVDTEGDTPLHYLLGDRKILDANSFHVFLHKTSSEAIGIALATTNKAGETIFDVCVTAHTRRSKQITPWDPTLCWLQSEEKHTEQRASDEANLKRGDTFLQQLIHKAPLTLQAIDANIENTPDYLWEDKKSLMQLAQFVRDPSASVQNDSNAFIALCQQHIITNLSTLSTRELQAWLVILEKANTVKSNDLTTQSYLRSFLMQVNFQLHKNYLKAATNHACAVPTSHPISGSDLAVRLRADAHLLDARLFSLDRQDPDGGEKLNEEQRHGLIAGLPVRTEQPGAEPLVAFTAEPESKHPDGPNASNLHLPSAVLCRANAQPAPLPQRPQRRRALSLPDNFFFTPTARRSSSVVASSAASDTVAPATPSENQTRTSSSIDIRCSQG